jgi:predicted 3-demethylubiquinone-9 3-methyltransferase (glyoxalase superfamily)
MVTTQKIAPCLWFDTQAEEAARFYVSVFKNSRIGKISHYGKEGFEIHHRPAGSVMVAEFEIEGQRFVALNGGPQFKFSEAVSFQIPCETQKEIDYYVDRLSEGGEIGPCGWLKDKFGLSWQIFPTSLPAMMSDPDTAKSSRAMRAMLGMKKIDLAQLQAAYEGR